jgi:hypothetical protein
MPLDRSLDQADEVCGKILRLDQTLLPAQPNQRRLVIAHVEIGASDFYQRDGVGTSLDVGKADSASQAIMCTLPALRQTFASIFMVPWYE